MVLGLSELIKPAMIFTFVNFNVISFSINPFYMQLGKF